MFMDGGGEETGIDGVTCVRYEVTMHRQKH